MKRAAVKSQRHHALDAAFPVEPVNPPTLRQWLVSDLAIAFICVGVIAAFFAGLL